MRATLILSDLSEGSLGEIESVGERENVDRQTMREGERKKERESGRGREGERLEIGQLYKNKNSVLILLFNHSFIGCVDSNIKVLRMISNFQINFL